MTLVLKTKCHICRILIVYTHLLTNFYTSAKCCFYGQIENAHKNQLNRNACSEASVTLEDIPLFRTEWNKCIYF